MDLCELSLPQRDVSGTWLRGECSVSRHGALGLTPSTTHNKAPKQTKQDLMHPQSRDHVSSLYRTTCRLLEKKLVASSGSSASGETSCALQLSPTTLVMSSSKPRLWCEHRVAVAPSLAHAFRSPSGQLTRGRDEGRTVSKLFPTEDGLGLLPTLVF